MKEECAASDERLCVGVEVVRQESLKLRQELRLASCPFEEWSTLIEIGRKGRQFRLRNQRPSSPLSAMNRSQLKS